MQDFDVDQNPWGTGYCLDSASTMWVFPTPDGNTVGDIALVDEIQGNDVYPLVTAFVRHDNYEEPSRIHLKLKDYTGNDVDLPPELETFSANEDDPEPWCRHPAVEVTYFRENDSDLGFLRVHVMWAEFNELTLEDSWDLFYRRYQFFVTSGGVNWGVPMYETIRLPFCTDTGEEIQPDICILASLNDLFAVCIRRIPDHPTNDIIWGARHPSDHINSINTWEGPYPVSDLNFHEKWAPRVDAGLFTDPSPDPPHHLIGRVAAVWCDKLSDDPYADWQVFWNDWDPWGEPNPYAMTQISWPDQPDEITFLPQIDIAPRSSGINEAIVAWSSAEWEQGVGYHNQRTRFTATPYLIDSVYEFGGSRYSRCQDVACYQMNDPDEHWFGLAYYHSDGEQPPWQVQARSFSFYIDDDLEKAIFEFQYDTHIVGSNGQWDPDYPFSGATLCLRAPDDPPDGSQFGLGWIDVGYAAMLALGDIQE